jgi:hypothetical protein
MRLDGGACVSDVDNDGYIALDYAVQSGCESIIQCLELKEAHN